MIDDSVQSGGGTDQFNSKDTTVTKLHHYRY